MKKKRKRARTEEIPAIQAADAEKIGIIETATTIIVTVLIAPAEGMLTQIFLRMNQKKSCAKNATASVALMPRKDGLLRKSNRLRKICLTRTSAIVLLKMALTRLMTMSMKNSMTPETAVLPSAPAPTSLIGRKQRRLSVAVAVAVIGTALTSRRSRFPVPVNSSILIRLPELRGQPGWKPSGRGGGTTVGSGPVILWLLSRISWPAVKMWTGSWWCVSEAVIPRCRLSKTTFWWNTIFLTLKKYLLWAIFTKDGCRMFCPAWKRPL